MRKQKPSKDYGSTDKDEPSENAEIAPAFDKKVLNSLYRFVFIVATTALAGILVPNIPIILVCSASVVILIGAYIFTDYHKSVDSPSN
jgi:hypothetical protein